MWWCVVVVCGGGDKVVCGGGIMYGVLCGTVVVWYVVMHSKQCVVFGLVVEVYVKLV